MSVNYSELSDTQLKQKYVILSKEVAKYNNFQMAKKILMNSLYGAAGNIGFRFYDPRMAEGITLTGQYFIRAVGDAIDTYLRKVSGTQLPSTFYQDTDSLEYSSIIMINGEEISIGDFYNSTKTEPFVTASGVEIKPVFNKTSIGFDGVRVTEDKVVYVMKHTVKKRMFQVMCNGKSVKVTADHSMMVIRGGVMISATPTELQKGDKIIMLNNEKLTNFS